MGTVSKLTGGTMSYGKFLLAHWVKTLVVFMLVAVFLAGPLVMLYNATIGRVVGSRGNSAAA